MRQHFGCSAHFSVLVPWSPHPTEWHPTEPDGPFRLLSRGAFYTANEARKWADSHLCGQPWRLAYYPFTVIDWRPETS